MIACPACFSTLKPIKHITEPRLTLLGHVAPKILWTSGCFPNVRRTPEMDA